MSKRSDKSSGKFTFYFGDVFVDELRRQVAWAQRKDPNARLRLARVARRALEDAKKELEKKYGAPPRDFNEELL